MCYGGQKTRSDNKDNDFAEKNRILAAKQKRSGTKKESLPAH